MAKMRAVQVSRRPGAPLELVEREIPRAAARHGPDQGRGLRRVPQRRGGGRRGSFPGIAVSARPRSRGHRGRSTRSAPGSPAGGRASASASAGTAARRHLRPCRRGEFFACATGADHGRHLRRRLRRVHGRAVQALARIPDELSPAERRRSCAPASPPTTRCAQRRPRRRRGGGARHRRPRPPRHPVRGEDGLPHRRHRARRATRRRSREARRARLHRQPRPKTPAAELDKLGGAKVISRRRPAARRRAR